MRTDYVHVRYQMNKINKHDKQKGERPTFKDSILTIDKKRTVVEDTIPLLDLVTDRVPSEDWVRTSDLLP